MNCYKVQNPLTNRKLIIAMAMLLIATVSWAEDSPWLLGDWNGKRNDLAEEGLEFEFVLTLEGVQNVSGGVAQPDLDIVKGWVIRGNDQAFSG